MVEIEEPSINQNYYTCPHCSTTTDQVKIPLFVHHQAAGNPSNPPAAQEYGRAAQPTSTPSPYAAAPNLTMRVCKRCLKACIWYKLMLVYPLESSVGAIHPDMPENIVQDVEEARAIMSLSPRASCALLRLALEKLCRHITGSDEKLNDLIGVLVRDYHLSPVIEQALDVVRVVGNDKVHPGKLDSRDDTQDAGAIYSMLNNIVEELITRPRLYKEQFSRLTHGQLNAIERRNQKLREKG